MKDKIAKIINKWDPIALFPMAPEDEYINEIENIEKTVQYNMAISVDDLANEIYKLFIVKFGEDVFQADINKCKIIASEIVFNC